MRRNSPRINGSINHNCVITIYIMLYILTGPVINYGLPVASLCYYHQLYALHNI